MKQLMKAELIKLKRMKMTYVGYLSILFSAIVTSFQVMTVNTGSVTYANFTEMYLYNNALLFFPFAIALTGGFMIDREYVQDTQKNLLVIPVNWGNVICAKIILLFLMTLGFGLASAILSGIVCLVLRCPDLTLFLFLVKCLHFLILGVFINVGILPVILWFSKKGGTYVWGSLFAALLGISGVFVTSGKLVNWHPITFCFLFVCRSHTVITRWGIAQSCMAFTAYSLCSVCVFCFIYKKH